MKWNSCVKWGRSFLVSILGSLSVLHCRRNCLEDSIEATPAITGGIYGVEADAVRAVVLQREPALRLGVIVHQSIGDRRAAVPTTDQRGHLGLQLIQVCE